VVRAIGLLSGGLDSILAFEVIRRLGIDVVAVSFFSPFFGADRVSDTARRLGVELLIEELTDEFLAMLPKPRYGYGSNMNPCIDCKALMYRRAGQMMEMMGADFVFSGEVLGQRPMSQNKQSLHISAKLSGFEDYIVRPLSAKLLGPTLPEREGKLEREKLLEISGRSRQPQMVLAERFGIKSFPSAAGGCRLTDPGYARRLKRLLSISETPSVRLIRLLRLGRHIRLDDSTTLIVGRCKSENDQITSLALFGEMLLEVVGYMGPTALITPTASQEVVPKAAAIVARYSDAPRESEVNVRLRVGSHVRTICVRPASPDLIAPLLV